MYNFSRINQIPSLHIRTVESLMSIVWWEILNKLWTLCFSAFFSFSPLSYRRPNWIFMVLRMRSAAAVAVATINSCIRPTSPTIILKIDRIAVYFMLSELSHDHSVNIFCFVCFSHPHLFLLQLCSVFIFSFLLFQCNLNIHEHI